MAGTQRDERQLPEGLPATFVGSRAGFACLCELLQIQNRDHRQAVFDHIKSIHPELKTALGSQTAVRHEQLLTRYYRSPSARLDRWREVFAKDDDSRRLPSRLPSLEYHALQRYDKTCLERTADDSTLQEHLASFPGLIGSLTEEPEWKHPALAIWPELQRDVMDWDNLQSDRRLAVVGALLAVSTILDDGRLLGWAGTHAPALAQEFAFARPEEDKPSANDRQEPLDHDSDDVIRVWRLTCSRIAACASKLGGDPPQLAHLPELQAHVRRLHELHVSVTLRLEEADTSRLLETIAERISALVVQHDVPWLRDAAQQIQAQWKLACSRSEERERRSFLAETERVERELPRAIEKWRESSSQRESLDAALTNLLERPRGDLASELTVSEKETELRSAVARKAGLARQAMLDVLVAIAPRSARFEPSRDYLQEWNERSGDAGAPPEASATLDVAVPARSESVVVEPQVSATNSASRQRTVEASNTVQEDRASSMGASGKPASAGRVVGGTGDVQQDEPEPISDPPTENAPAVAAQWRLLPDRPAISCQIVQLLAGKARDLSTVPPVDLLKAAILAQHVYSGESMVVEAIRSPLGRIRELDPPRRKPDQEWFGLLMLCATFRPTLLAPTTGALSLLKEVSLTHRLAPVAKLVGVVSDHAERLRGAHLDGAVLGAALNAAMWRERFERLVEDVRDWRGKAEARRNKFAGARRVWSRWLQTDGCLGELAQCLQEDEAAAGRTRRVEQLVKDLADPKSFVVLVRDADKRETEGKRPAITGGALKQLQTHSQPILDLGRKWLRLMAVKPPSTGFVEAGLVELRRDLERYGAAAFVALDALKTEKSGAVAAAATLASRSLRATCELVCEGGPGEAPAGWRQALDTEAHLVLGRDLLYVTELDVDERCELVPTEDAKATLELLVDADRHAASMEAACERRIERGDFVGARLAWEDLETTGEASADRCRAALHEAIVAKRGELFQALERVEEETEDIFHSGQLGDEQRSTLVAQLSNLRLALDDETGIDAAARALEEVEGAIGGSAPRRPLTCVADWQKWRRMKGRLTQRRVRQAIAERDLRAAIELLGKIESGEKISIVDGNQEDAFLEFLSLLPSLEGTLEGRGARNPGKSAATLPADVEWPA